MNRLFSALTGGRPQQLPESSDDDDETESSEGEDETEYATEYAKDDENDERDDGHDSSNPSNHDDSAEKSSVEEENTYWFHVLECEPAVHQENGSEPSIILQPDEVRQIPVLLNLCSVPSVIRSSFLQLQNSAKNTSVDLNFQPSVKKARMENIEN
jgi:hypothetical protein